MSEEKRRVSISPSDTCVPAACAPPALGVDLVIGGARLRIWDLDGRELLDLHLNGGVFNLGHRNPS